MSTNTIPAGTHVVITTVNGGRASGHTIFDVQVPDGTGLGDVTAAIVDDHNGRTSRVGSFAGPIATVTSTDAPSLDADTVLGARREWIELRAASWDGPVWGTAVWKAVA
jgi:hypothetical protein